MILLAKTANVTSRHSVTDKTCTFIICEMSIIVLIIVQFFIFVVRKLYFIFVISFSLLFI